MPNLREKIWTTTTPANVEDAQYWEDHLISDEDAAKIGTVILPAGGTAGQVLTKQSGSPNDADWDDPASSGHTIEDENGTDMPYQQTLQFVNAEVSNDSANDRTVVDCKGAKGDAATITVGTVSTLPAGSSATVVNSGTTKDAVFDFGIPEGADGTDGEDGFSPAVTITSIPGGHQVNITDEDHPQGQTFNVMDGAGSGDMQASVYDSNGDVANAGGIAGYVSDKADKVSNATNGNFAGLDSNGNLTDSGKSSSDFLPSNTPIPDAVTANPQGTATGTLTKLGIGSDIYEIQGGGGGSDKADISAIGTNETGATASKAYAVDEHFYKDGKFCTVKAAIAQGAQFTLGTNYVEGTVADVVNISDYSNQLTLASGFSFYTDSGNNSNSDNRFLLKKCGKFVHLYFQIRINQNLSADTTYTPVTIPAAVCPPCMIGVTSAIVDMITGKPFNEAMFWLKKNGNISFISNENVTPTITGGKGNRGAIFEASWYIN